MACCCKSGKSNKSSVSCLGRCDLPKHRCLSKEEKKPGPVPKCMGWHYTAKDAPEHQLRCGWRPGHISCPVLRKIELHNCYRTDCFTPCPLPCPRLPCIRLPCIRPSNVKNSCCLPKSGRSSVVAPPPTWNYAHVKPPPVSGKVSIRIVRHGGNYTICTKPSNVNNSPSGPYPLKYVLNVDKSNDSKKSDSKKKEKLKSETKYSVEAKFNDYRFDYTCSQTSFILDFAPPETRCFKPCPKKSFMCALCRE